MFIHQLQASASAARIHDNNNNNNEKGNFTFHTTKTRTNCTLVNGAQWEWAIFTEKDILANAAGADAGAANYIFSFMNHRMMQIGLELSLSAVNVMNRSKQKVITV